MLTPTASRGYFQGWAKRARLRRSSISSPAPAHDHVHRADCRLAGRSGERYLMANETFNKRFKQLVQGLSDTELGYVLGVSADAARKMRQGDIKSLKLQAALRLARKLDISPWYIACEPEPTTPLPPLPQTRGTHKAS